MWVTKTNLKCEKCSSKNVYKETSCMFIPAQEKELPKDFKTNVLYGHQPWWYRCYSCNWIFGGEFENEEHYYKEPKQIKSKPKKFYQLNHKWQWMPHSKDEERGMLKSK